MADILTKEKRSAVMATVRSHGNRATELRLATLLRSAKIVGWRRHQRLPGLPDFVFRQARVAVFVDGCFWHGCRKHCRMPQANASYWRRKISGNKARDHRVRRALSERGWTVLRIWEHDLKKDSDACVRRIKLALLRQLPSGMGRGSKATAEFKPRAGIHRSCRKLWR